MDLGAAYDRAFFLEYGAKNEAYVRACRIISQEIFRRFSPRTVIDWGCGAGLHAAALAKLGAEVTAVDGVCADTDLRNGFPIVVQDLRQPVTAPLPESYDLSLCVDVLEHIEEEHAEQVLGSITQGASLVILSCAPPGQGGHHHVNEQPRRYWVEKMKGLGWHYDRRETGSMERVFLGMRDVLPWSWMYHNLCVYRPHPVQTHRVPKRRAD